MVELVGILNITPDSFSDGGQFLDAAAAIARAEQLFAEGAALVDVGAESTRPNAVALTEEEEWSRLEPVLRPLLKHFPGKISLDSFHPGTVERAYAIGPVIINDVTGMNNPAMLKAAIKLHARCIISHLPSTDIQTAHRDMPVTTVEQVKQALLERKALLVQGGIPAEQIILDPGIGFGKTMELNRELLRFAAEVPGHPVMIGYSRKRFLGDQRMELTPNLAAGREAIAAGARYLRVHDVKGHAELLR